MPRTSTSLAQVRSEHSPGEGIHHERMIAKTSLIASGSTAANSAQTFISSFSDVIRSSSVRSTTLGQLGVI